MKTKNIYCALLVEIKTINILFYYGIIINSVRLLVPFPYLYDLSVIFDSYDRI